MILSCSNITKSFGDKHILKQVSFHLEDHEKAAIVGINGAGKTTLLKIMIGELAADEGVVALSKGTTIGYLAQHQDLDSENTIYEALLEVKRPVIEMEERIRSLELKMHSASGDALEAMLAEYSRLNHAFELADGYAYKSEVTGVLKGLGFSEDEFTKPINTLSGGQKTRVSLGKLLLTKPDVLLLDEPTNHLDMESIAWLETYLKSYAGSVIIVAHDRYFLDRVVNRIFAFEGQGRVTQYEGGFTDYQRTAKAGESQAGNRADTGETLTAGGAANTPEAQDGNQAVKRNNWKEGQNVTRKLKLSFKEQRDWETIEEDIAGLEAAVEELEKEIIRSSSNYTRLNELMAEKDAKEKELEEKMERWMYLNELMEQIEAQK